MYIFYFPAQSIYARIKLANWEVKKLCSERKRKQTHKSVMLNVPMSKRQKQKVALKVEQEIVNSFFKKRGTIKSFFFVVYFKIASTSSIVSSSKVKLTLPKLPIVFALVFNVLSVESLSKSMSISPEYVVSSSLNIVFAVI